MNTRAIAAKILYKVIAQHQSLDQVLTQNTDQAILKKDRALIQELCCGTLRWFQRLDYLAKLQLTKAPKKMDALVYAIILLGLYQLLYLRVPDHAAISESVGATRVLKKNWASGLVNAVLRGFMREKEKFLQIADDNLEAQYSHPEWLIAKIQAAWPNDWQAILIANNEYPPMHLRVNVRKNSVEQYLEKLKAAKINGFGIAHVKSAITLENPVDVASLPEFAEGAVSVQDLAPQLAAELLELQPGMRVLDACAAPGNKTAHLLESEPKLAEVVALEVDDERIKILQENLKRLNLRVTTIVGDAQAPQEWWDGKQFERILLDAPCSATGVIRRHPDIKLLRQADDIINLARKQLALLEALWPLLAVDGILLYATCSVLPQENSKIITQFLRKHYDAKESKIYREWGIATDNGWQLFPTSNGSDGFFYSKLKKVK